MQNVDTTTQNYTTEEWTMNVIIGDVMIVMIYYKQGGVILSSSCNQSLKMYYYHGKK